MAYKQVRVWSGERPGKTCLLLPELEAQGFPEVAYRARWGTCCLGFSSRAVDGREGVSLLGIRLVPQGGRKWKGTKEVRRLDDRGIQNPVPPVTLVVHVGEGSAFRLEGSTPNKSNGGEVDNATRLRTGVWPGIHPRSRFWICLNHHRPSSLIRLGDSGCTPACFCKQHCTHRKSENARNITQLLCHCWHFSFPYSTSFFPLRCIAPSIRTFVLRTKPV